MIPAIGRTMTTGTETDTVPGETQTLLLAPPQRETATSAGVDDLADARAEARRWSPNTRRAYVAGWKGFTSWCLENRRPGRPAAPSDVGRYLEHLVGTEGKKMATARMRQAAIAAAHRLGGQEDPTTRPLVKATMKRLAREYGNPRKQAKGLTSKALAEDTYTLMACTLGGVHPRAGQHEHGLGKGGNRGGHPPSFSGTRRNSRGSCRLARVN